MMTKEVFRILRNLMKEYVHHVDIDKWKNQSGHFPQRRTDGCEDVHVLPHNLPGNHGPDTLGRPTWPMLIYAAKSAFILRSEDPWYEPIRASGSK
jgi:hypothetical protein